MNVPAVPNTRLTFTLLDAGISLGAPVVASKATVCVSPLKLNVIVPPTVMSMGVGVNVANVVASTVAALGNPLDTTVVVFSANFVLSATDVARMCALPAATAVTRPVEFTVATALLSLVHETCCEALLPTFTVALSCAFCPTVSDDVPGVTLTEFTMAVASIRIFDDVAFLVASNTDVAVMDTDPGDTAVTSPVLLTVAIALLLLVHVTAVDAPPTAVTVAVSCDVVPTINAAGAADSTTDVTAGAMFTVSVALPLLVASNADVAVIVAVPALTAVTSPACDTVAMAEFDVVQLTAVDAPLSAVTAALSVT